jgi:hypothetical protein
MAKYKKRERLKKPSDDGLKPVPIEDGATTTAHPEENEKETVAGMQQLYGNRVVQRLAGDASPVGLNGDVAARINTSRGRGNPLDKEMAQAMNSSFARDFSSVRLHDDSEANSLAHELHAQAFTVGNDIYVNNGGMDLHTEHGVDILSHELTHVVQQSGASGDAGTLVSRPDLEQEADGTAGAASHVSSIAVQRTEDPPLTERLMTAEMADTEIRERFQSFIQQFVQSEGRTPAAAGRINIVEDSVFRQHYDLEYDTPEDRAAHPYEGINAFVDAGGIAWVHRERGTVGTVIHEALHMYSQPEALEEAMGRQGKEGMTEYFTKKVCLHMGFERDYEEYADAAQCIDALAEKAGEIWVQNAFFRGHIWALGHHLDMLLGVPHAWSVWCRLMSSGRFDDATRILTMEPEQLQETIERLWGQMTGVEQFLVPG